MKNFFLGCCDESKYRCWIISFLYAILDLRVKVRVRGSERVRVLELSYTRTTIQNDYKNSEKEIQWYWFLGGCTVAANNTVMQVIEDRHYWHYLSNIIQLLPTQDKWPLFFKKLRWIDDKRSWILILEFGRQKALHSYIKKPSIKIFKLHENYRSDPLQVLLHLC